MTKSYLARLIKSSGQSQFLLHSASMENSTKHVYVGISGGVDSAVAALLLKEQGFSVTGIFMKNWEDDDNKYCNTLDDLLQAKKVCDQLKIPLKQINFSNEYWQYVFTEFLIGLKKGGTPNPDIMCNKEIKFKVFLDYAKHLGADKIATGHYASIKKNDDTYQLVKGADSNKDQSYFLHTLNQTQLANSIFPLSELTKSQVRELARKAKLPNYARKDSTGICFIGKRKFKSFLNQYLPMRPGLITTPEGKSLGEHDGLIFYTIGQREGLGIGGKQEGLQAPWYVADKDFKNNRLVVVQGKDHPLLWRDFLYADNIHWISGTAPRLPLSLKAKIRYRQGDQDCTISRSDDKTLYAKFTKPQRAITPGQSIVFYRDNICLGGAIISSKL